MTSGVIRCVVGDRGFGFVSSDSGRDIFFHYSELSGVKFQSLKEGAKADLPGRAVYQGAHRQRYPALPATRLKDEVGENNKPPGASQTGACPGALVRPASTRKLVYTGYDRGGKICWKGDKTTRHFKINVSGEGRRTDDNLLRFHGDAASSAVEDAAGAYQSPSIIAAGADATSVSALVTFINLSMAVLCIKAPAIIERVGLTKRGAVVLSFANIVSWIPLIIAFLLSRLGIAPTWFAIFWFVNLVPTVLLSVQRDNWLSNLVPGSSLGRYLGQRLAIKSAFYLGSFILLGYLLDAFGGTSLAGFAFIFILAMVSSLVDFIIFTFMNDSRPAKQPAPPPAPPPPPSNLGLFEFFGDLKAKKLGTFVTFTSLFYFSVGLCGPLYAVYMLQERHFTYLSFTMIISAEYFARIVSVTFWGRLADRVGNIRVLAIVSKVIPLIPVFWLFSSNLGYLAFVQVMSGVCWGAYDLCTQSYLYKVAPREGKLRYIVYTRSLVLLSTALGGLMGAFFVNGIFMTFGSRILSVFMISGIFRAIIALYLMPGLVDLAVKYVHPSGSHAISFAYPGTSPPSKHGLYYQRPEPKPLPAGKGARVPVAVPVSLDIPRAQRRAMALEGKRTPVLAERIREKPAGVASMRGWYRDPDMRRAHEPSPARPPKPEPEISRSLYHDEDLKKALVAAASPPPKKSETVEKRTTLFRDPDRRKARAAAMSPPLKKETVETRNTLYHDPESWSNYMKKSGESIASEGKNFKAAVSPKAAYYVVEPAHKDYPASSSRCRKVCMSAGLNR